MSLVRKRSVAIRGHRTSYSLEQRFHDELAAIAATRAVSVAALIAEIDQARPPGTNLSSAIRVYVLDEVKASRGPTGSARASASEG